MYIPEIKNVFFIIYFNLLLLNLQKCQILLTHPVYVYILKYILKAFVR